MTVVSHGLPACVSDEQVKLRVIGLLDCIRTIGTMAMHQLKLIAEAGRTFMGKCN